MRPVVRIKFTSIKPKRFKGERTRDYMDRTRFIQMTAELTAWQASQVLDGGNSEAKLRGEHHG